MWRSEGSRESVVRVSVRSEMLRFGLEMMAT